MTDINRNDLNYQSWRSRVLFRIKVGLQTICADKRYIRNSIILFSIFVVYWLIRFVFLGPDNKDVMAALAWRSSRLTSIFLFIILIIVYVLAYSQPFEAMRSHKSLLRAGFVNSVGEPPMLVSLIYDGPLMRYQYSAEGIALKEWEDNKEVLENALNIVIGQIKETSDKQHILMTAVDGSFRYPEKMYWQARDAIKKDEIVIGRNLYEDVAVSLNTYPHFLIGGSTGSGKTVLLKFMLMQCLRNGYKVIIADFKGGVDYINVWHETCTFICDKDTVTKKLIKLLTTLESRKKILRDAGCVNISEYNRLNSLQLERIIFACDEVAELLDKTGADKVNKELSAKIESMIATIARQGRAFGIHLILATQRPDANIISGQIKNNIDYRVCGRADNVLAQIILDTADAASQIPKDEPGMFLNQEGIIFKGYLFEEADMKRIIQETGVFNNHLSL